jgi:membrane peptidoglycan carboxypeptidase
VETQKHDVVYRAKKKTERVFDEDVMADTTYAMTKVFDCGIGGTACGRALTDRPVAGKTGTNGKPEGNVDAWFIGFTPQLSTAVWYGNTNRKKPVTSNGAQVYGAGLPAQTWQAMMTQAMSGKPVESFPPPAHVGTSEGTVTTTPSPTDTTATPSESPSETPSVVPTTVSPTATTTVVPPHTKSPKPTSSPTPTQTQSASPAAAESPGGRSRNRNPG